MPDWHQGLRLVSPLVARISGTWSVYVKAYFKRQKNDASDAEAICEAIGRVNMRFVPTKTLKHQNCLGARHLFIRQQTAVINSIREVRDVVGLVRHHFRKAVIVNRNQCRFFSNSRIQ